MVVTAAVVVVLKTVVMIVMLVVAVVMLMLVIMKMMVAVAEQCFKDVLPLNIFCEFSVVILMFTQLTQKKVTENSLSCDVPLPALHSHPLSSSVEGGLERVAWSRWPKQESKEGVGKKVKEQRELGCHGGPMHTALDGR